MRTVEPDRYAVVGNPVAHSLSPLIHAAFADATGEAVRYDRLLAPLDGFVATVDGFFGDGGRGVNVTVPFKREAFDLCGRGASARARDAGAVNVLAVTADGIRGDNTDGIGLVVDLERHVDLRGARVLLLGAGGAARGVLQPLVDAGVREIVIANRDRAKAEAIVRAHSRVVGLDGLAAVEADVIVNATSIGLSDEALPVPPAVFARARCAYDLVYGARPTRFLRDAERAGTPLVVDGLGMLVEQAAESFRLWRGVRPETAPVLASLRTMLARAS